MIKIKPHGLAKAKLDVKRLNLPFTIKAICPQCGKEVQKHLDGDAYLSYPKINTPIKVSFAHEDEPSASCHEWSEVVIVRVTIEAVAVP